MATDPTPLLGGKSVFCINEEQMAEATRLTENDHSSSPKIKAELSRIEKRLSRNEQAALAFTLIKRLKETVPVQLP